MADSVTDGESLADKATEFLKHHSDRIDKADRDATQAEPPATDSAPADDAAD